MISDIGRWLMVLGLVLLLLGILLTWLPSTRIGRFPGDFVFRRENWTIYVPLGTSLLVSLILTGLLWILALLFRK